MNLPGFQGQQMQPPTPGPPGDRRKIPAAAAAPHVPLAQQGRAQIAVQPPGGHGGAGAGLAQATASTGAEGPPSQEYSGIAMALECLALVMADADTARNLQWQQEVGEDLTKLTTWKLKATASPGPQFFTYMQPGEAFLVVGHSMATVNSTTADIASFHGKVVLFMGDYKGTHECIPVILPPQSAFEWKKCSVVDDKENYFCGTPTTRRNTANCGIPWPMMVQK
jgi:hypothetical protein